MTEVLTLEKTTQGSGIEIEPYIATSEENDDIVYAQQFKTASFNQTRRERKQWRNSYERYRLERKLSEYDYIEDVPFALTYDAVEKSVANLPGREFGFDAKPAKRDDGADDIKDAILFSRVIDRDWRSPDIMDGPTKMEVIKRSMALFGNCFTQIPWEIIANGDGEVIKNGPNLIPLNIFDCYYNKFFSEVDQLPEFGYETRVSLDWFRANAKKLGFKNWESVQGVTAAKVTTYDEDSGTIDKQETPSSNLNDTRLRMVRLFEVVSNNTILTLAMDTSPVWLRKIPNKAGTKGVVLFRWKRNPLPNRLLGVSDIAQAGSIDDAVQRAANQSIFNSLLVDNPMFTYNKLDQYIDPRTFVAAPGGGIPRGSDPNSITPLLMDSHMRDSLEMINALAERFKRVANVPDISGGYGDPNADTATANQIIDQNAKAGYNLVVDSIKNSMQKMATILQNLYEKFGPDDISLKVYEPELLKKLKPEVGLVQGMAEQGVDVNTTKQAFSIKRDIDITVDFTTQNKAILSRNIVNFLQIAANDQAVSPQLKIMCYKEWLTFNDLDDLALKFEQQGRAMGSSDVTQADSENQQMAQGEMLPPTQNPTPQHTQRHIEFLRTNTNNPELHRALDQHIKGELEQLQGQAGQLNPTDGGQTAGGTQPMGESTNPVNANTYAPSA
jgi:hypothetical protein